MGRTRSDTNRGCDTPGCPRRHYAKGLCRRHYMMKWHANNKASSANPLSATPASVPEPKETPLFH